MSKKFWSCFYAFRSALFGLSVFYANELYFQPFRKFFRRVLPMFLFHSGTDHQRARHSQETSPTRSPQLGGTLVCAAQQLKRYYDPEDLCGEEWELHDE